MDTLLQDLRFGIKLLWKEKGLTATILTTLAVCIGANTAVYSVVDAVLLDPLPYPASDRLVRIYNSYPGAGATRGSTSAPDFFFRRDRVEALEIVAQYQGWGSTVGPPGSTERLASMRVTPSFFTLLGGAALLGRTFTEDEIEPGSHQRVVLSYGYWREEFGSDPGVLGRELRVDGQSFTIVGVLPASFRPPTSRDIRLYLPIPYEAADRTAERLHNNDFTMIARLDPGATVEQAQGQIAALDAVLVEQWPIPNAAQILEDAGYHAEVVNLKADAVREARPVFYLLWGGVAFVLLIGCVNIANLMVARASSRRQELATRLALGADRARVARQLVTEAALLALAGGGLGLAIGAVGIRLMETVGVHELPLGTTVGIDGDIVFFTAAAALLAGAIFGGIPIFHLYRADLTGAFRSESRGGTASRTVVTLRSALVTAQVGLAFVLLIGAGLLLASFRSALEVDPGFQPDPVLTGHVSLPDAAYPDGESRRLFVREFLEEVRSLPGVESASVTSAIPFGGNYPSSVIMPEGYALEPGESILSPYRTVVAPGYFDALGIEIIEGRGFTEADTEGGWQALVIDRRLADRYWPDRSPLGHRMLRGVPEMPDLSEDDYYTIVGVADVIKQDDLTEDQGVGAYYMAYDQNPRSTFTVVVRTDGNPLVLTSGIRKVVADIDPDLPFYLPRTLRDRVDESLRDRRAPMMLMGLFAGVALFLAAVGIYGVLAYSVAQRRRELGIRLALGSSPGKLFRMVVGQGSRVVAVGLAFGAIASLILVRTIRSLLFEVQPGDPVVIGVVALGLALVGLTATAVPAHRATRVDPVRALSD